MLNTLFIFHIFFLRCLFLNCTFSFTFALPFLLLLFHSERINFVVFVVVAIDDDTILFIFSRYFHLLKHSTDENARKVLRYFPYLLKAVESRILTRQAKQHEFVSIERWRCFNENSLCVYTAFFFYSFDSDSLPYTNANVLFCLFRIKVFAWTSFNARPCWRDDRIGVKM